MFLGKSIFTFQKWTKKMSKNENPKKLSHKKNSKIHILDFSLSCFEIYIIFPKNCYYSTVLINFVMDVMVFDISAFVPTIGVIIIYEFE